jgi:hypothetical protein
MRHRLDSSMRLSCMKLMVSIVLASFQLFAQVQEPQVQMRREEQTMKNLIFYRTAQIDGLSIFYRESGPKDAPTILLLHGLPSSSRMFEPLFARLSDRYHLVAPDYPGFGHSDWPDPKTFAYTFDHIRGNHESLHRSARSLALHPLHAGLRWPRRFSHDLGSPGPSRSSHRPGRGSTQHRSRVRTGKRGAPFGLIALQRKRAAHKSPVACNHEVPPRGERSQRGTP